MTAEKPTTETAAAYYAQEAEKAQKMLGRLEDGKVYTGWVDFTDGRRAYFDSETTEQVREKMKKYDGIGLLHAWFRSNETNIDVSGD